MPRDAERPWWDDAQDYRHRTERRRFAQGGRSDADLGVDLPAVERLADRAEARSLRRRDPESRAAALRAAGDRRSRIEPEDPFAVETPAERAARRRRRAASARAAAQERRASRDREDEPVAFAWAWESPYATPGEDHEVAVARVEHQRHARREARATGRPVPARRRRGPHPIVARPERILLWAALLGLFLVLAAASSGDAATVAAALGR